MNRVLIKDILREIRRTLSRFLSIFVIVAIGVSFFAGVRATGPDMELTADQYFDEYNLMDIRLLSTMGFDDKDLEAIRQQPELTGLYPAYTMDAIANIKDKDVVLKVLSLPVDKLGEPDEGYINRAKLVEGRMPQRADECVTERGKIKGTELAIGTKLKLSSGTDQDIGEKLKVTEYTVVGIVETPYYISFERGTSSIGNGKVSGFIMIPQQSFDMPVYTDVFATVKGADALNSFDDSYQDLIDPVVQRLEHVGKQREQERYEEIVAEAEEQLQNSKDELSEAEQKQQTELGEAEDKLDEARKEIAGGEKQLRSKKNELKQTFEAAAVQISEGYSKLAAGKQQYEAQLAQLAQAKQLGADVAAAEQQLAATRAALDAGRAQLADEEAKLAASRQKAEAELAAAEKKLAAAREELVKGEAEYEKAKQESQTKLEEARRKIETAEQQIKELEKPKWYVLDRNTNPGFVDYKNAAERMDAIAQVFPAFFFLIAALVCLTTMTRMVDEQRTAIGALKALGYSKASIAAKYLSYAILASVAGSVFGVLVGFVVFPTVIFNAYGIMYTLPPVITAFNTTYAAVSIAFAVLSTTIAAWFACYKELMVTPALLMRPKAPKAGKRILLERIRFLWNRLNFTQKVTARNLFRYKKRFFMTILGIGGCTALLLSGFGLKDSIMSIVTKQFDELYQYDMVVDLKEAAISREALDLGAILDQRITDFMLTKEQSVEVGAGKQEKSVTLMIPESGQRLKDFILLRTRETGAEVAFPEDGVVLTEKLAKTLKVQPGDKIYIKDGDAGRLTVKVTGITENYVAHYIYITPKVYEAVYKQKPVYQRVVAKLQSTGEDVEDALSARLLKESNVSSVSFTTGISKSFADIISSLNYIVLVLIVSAGALAFVVLYNLTNINVTERLREIATIKVLGFYDNEVSHYVYRENILLTLIGMLLGLVLGVLLHRFIVVTAEVDYVMFGRSIKPASYAYSAVLTVFFSGLVNYVMYFKLRKINMVESLKSVD